MGETLFYYLVRVRPFDLDQIVDRMVSILEDLRLRSVRVFPVFGQWDILIRAWLHPTLINSFQTQLNSKLADSIKAHHTFAVSKIIRRWYERGQDIDNHLLENLDESTLRQVQSGQNSTLLNKLIDGQIVQIRDKPTVTAISFFIAMNLDMGTNAIYDDLIGALNDYLSNNPDVKNASIYRGYGFCQVLFKGQVQDYFNIAKLTNTISRQFKSVGINTETFLLHGPTHIIGNDGIGETTFLGLKGKNLFVQSIIPELYDDDFSIRHDIERFVDSEARNKEFTTEDKKLIRGYLVGLLSNDVTQMASTLFSYFTGLERFLRTNHARFIGTKTKRPLKEAYKAIGLEPSKKHLALGDLLRLYSDVIEGTDPQNKHLSGNWEDIATIRNQIAHGDEGFDTKWKEHLKVLFTQLPRLNQLVSIIEAGTIDTEDAKAGEGD